MHLVSNGRRFHEGIFLPADLLGKGDEVRLCCIAHKNKTKKPILWTNILLEAPLPQYCSCTTIRNSAITPDSPLIRTFTTLRSTLCCSHHSVAKRQQFSCLLGTATLSLKSENVVPGRWICYFSYSYCGQVSFLLLSSMSSTRTYEHFPNNLLRCNVFF